MGGLQGAEPEFSGAQLCHFLRVGPGLLPPHSVPQFPTCRMGDSGACLRRQHPRGLPACKVQMVRPRVGMAESTGGGSLRAGSRQLLWGRGWPRLPSWGAGTSTSAGQDRTGQDSPGAMVLGAAGVDRPSGQRPPPGPGLDPSLCYTATRTPGPFWVFMQTSTPRSPGSAVGCEAGSWTALSTKSGPKSGTWEPRE